MKSEKKFLLCTDLDCGPAVQEARLQRAGIKNVRALIPAGAQVNARNKLRQTALSIATEDKNDKLIKLLKEAGARP